MFLYESTQSRCLPEFESRSREWSVAGLRRMVQYFPLQTHRCSGIKVDLDVNHEQKMKKNVSIKQQISMIDGLGNNKMWINIHRSPKFTQIAPGFKILQRNKQKSISNHLWAHHECLFNENLNLRSSSGSMHWGHSTDVTTKLINFQQNL